VSEQGRWCTITEYSRLRGLSISTIRRYIKADRVKHKLENGKYLIMIGDQRLKQAELKEEEQVLKIKFENEELRKKLQMVQQELEDTKMLLTIYENTSTSAKKQTLPPELPSIPTGLPS
jgi:hypothetical protein